MSETGVAREGDVAQARSRSAPTSRSSCSKSTRPAAASASAPRRFRTRSEAEEVREYTERADAAPADGFGSLADKLRGALKKEK